MNIVCRICRGWILRQRIQAERSRLQRVAFACSHDAVLTQRLVERVCTRVGRNLKLFRAGEQLRIALYRALMEELQRYQTRYSDVLSFAPLEKMSQTRKPMTRQVRRAMAQLESVPRSLVALVDLGGCSYRELEQILDMPHSDILTQLCHARVQLKTLLFDPAPRLHSGQGTRLWSTS